jgi:hypothetical protein
MRVTRIASSYSYAVAPDASPSSFEDAIAVNRPPFESWKRQLSILSPKLELDPPSRSVEQRKMG